MSPSSNENDRSERRILKVDEIEFPFSAPTDKLIRNYGTLLVDGSEKGHGGFGQIFHVYTVKGESLALKMMLMPDSANFLSDATYQHEVNSRTRAFREEYETLCKLSSFRGFVKVFAYGTVEGTPAIVMEWVEGVSLGHAVPHLAEDPSGKKLPALMVAQLGRDIFHLLSRLEYQTELFVHRDISPANIMVRTHERSLEQQAKEGTFDLCFIDFGSAATMRQTDGSFTVYTNILRGATADYAPPEMLTNDLPQLGELRKSSKIDVYAACSVLFLLLCGFKPYDLNGDAGYYSEFLLKMEQAPKPSGYRDGTIEQALVDVISQGIKPQQSDRPSSYAMYRMLDYFVEKFQVNRERLAKGMAALTLDRSTIDVEDPSEIQIDMSNPLSKATKDAQPKAVRANGGADASQQVVYCHECGKPNPKDALLCGYCGRPLMKLNDSARRAPSPYGQTAQLQTPRTTRGASPSVQVAPKNNRAANPQKQARKNKKGVGKVVVGVLLVGLLGVGGFAGYTLSQQLLDNGAASASSSPSVASQASSVSSKSVSAESLKENPVGHWSGSLSQTSQRYACFGATQHPLDIVVSSISSTGQITCDVTVMYHGHSRRQQANDINSSAADVVQTYKGLTSSLSSGSFSLNLDESEIAGKDSRLEISCSIDDDGIMHAIVRSYFNGAETVDEFELGYSAS